MPVVEPRSALALGAVLLAAACASPHGIGTTGRTLDPAGLEAARTLVGAPLSPEPLERAWWKRYRDPQLDALVAEALEGNPSIGAVRARVEQARAAAATARLALTSSTSGSVEASRQRLSANGIYPPPLGGAWIWQNQAMLGYQYEFRFLGPQSRRLCGRAGR